MKTNVPELWKELIQSTNGKVFSITFVKKNGEVRRMTARTGVSKYVNGRGLPYNPAEYDLLPVFDFQKKDYRMVNLATIQGFKCGKIKI